MKPMIRLKPEKLSIIWSNLCRFAYQCEHCVFSQIFRQHPVIPNNFIYKSFGPSADTIISNAVAINWCHLLREVEATEPRSTTRPNTPFLDRSRHCGGGAFLYKQQNTDAAVSWCFSSICFIIDSLVDRHSVNVAPRGSREAEMEATWTDKSYQFMLSFAILLD